MTKDNFINPHKTVRAENLLKAFSLAGFNGWGARSRIAEEFKVSPQAVDRWLKNEYESQPSLDKLIKIAQMAGISLDELIIGSNNRHSRYRDVAILSLDEAVNYCLEGEIKAKNQTENSNVLDEFKQIPLTGKANKPFAIQNPDDSMAFVSGRSYPKNALLVFDAKPKAIKADDLVFAICNSFEVENQQEKITQQGIFRRYFLQHGKEYLLALNPSYPAISADFQIVAKFLYAICE